MIAHCETKVEIDVEPQTKKEKKEHGTISTRHITSPPQKKKLISEARCVLPQILVRNNQGIVQLGHIGIGN